MPEQPERRLAPLAYVGVSLLAASGLLLEIALTRIFSATIWHHFAFVAVSAALLGWGLGGFAAHLASARRRPSLRHAAHLSLLCAAAIPASLAFLVRFPFERERLPSYFLASVLPFLLIGMALALVFAIDRERAGRIYFADLLGASLGALAATLLLSWLGAPATVVAAALGPALAAACFWPGCLPASLVAALVVSVGLAGSGEDGIFAIRAAPRKGMYRHMAAAPEARIAMTGWNAYSRIDAVTGLSSSQLARLYIDADAWTNIHRWDGRLDSLRSLCTQYRALPFRLVRPRETLVIGPGGGFDVLLALGCGSERVIAVEMNPLMLRFVRHFGEAAGSLYDHPRVETHLAEGRHFVGRSERRFDLILLGFVDSWASLASGGLSLSENYLYTVEAFRSYYEHLTDDGMLVILRWDVDVPRLVSNAVALLGASSASERVAVVSESRRGGEEPPQVTFMLKRAPFSDVEARQVLEGWTQARALIVPGLFAEPPYDALLSGRTRLEEFAAAASERVDPVFDDRPFFFAREKPWGLPPAMSRSLLEILAPVVALSGLFMLFGRPRAAPVGPYAASLAYFGALGLGFITVELALLQQLGMLLGHPVYTLSLLLLTLLAASGAGSYASARAPLRAACLAVAGLALAYAFALPRLVPSLLGLPWLAGASLAVALLLPLGFAMGIPFPAGLLRTGRGPFPAPPFYWGLNGILSVIGSVATMWVALNLGFQAAMAIGSACYLAAAAAGTVLLAEPGPRDREGPGVIASLT